MRQYCSDTCEQSYEKSLKANGSCCNSARDCASEFCFRGTCVKSCLFHPFVNMKPIGACCEIDADCEMKGCRGSQCVLLPTAEELAEEKISFVRDKFYATVTLVVLGSIICILSCFLSLYLYMRSRASGRTERELKFAKASAPYSNNKMKIGPSAVNGQGAGGIYDSKFATSYL